MMDNMTAAEEHNLKVIQEWRDFYTNRIAKRPALVGLRNATANEIAGLKQALKGKGWPFKHVSQHIHNGSISIPGA